MSNNLGRDKVWTPEIWAEIDKAVLSEIGRIRVAQMVFPTATKAGAQFVEDEILVHNRSTMTIKAGQAKPFSELSQGFSLSQSQVESEATLHNGQTLARLAAKFVAMYEDEAIFQGDVAASPTFRATALPGKGKGLLGIAAKPVKKSVGANAVGEAILTAAVEGIGELIKQGQPGPYALILATSLFGEAHSPIGNSLATAADRLEKQIAKGIFGSSALLDDPAKIRQGLLVSLGGDPVTLYMAQDAVTAFTHQDVNGDYHFRVFELVQFVARDPSALVVLEITP